VVIQSENRTESYRDPLSGILF